MKMFMQVLKFKLMGSLIDFKQNYFNRLIKCEAWQSHQTIQSDYKHVKFTISLIQNPKAFLLTTEEYGLKFKGKITMFYTHEQRPTTVRIVQTDTNPLAQMGIKCADFSPTYCTRAKVNMCMDDGLFLPEISVLSEKANSSLLIAFLLFQWTRKVLLQKQGFFKKLL